MSTKRFVTDVFLCDSKLSILTFLLESYTLNDGTIYIYMQLVYMNLTMARKHKESYIFQVSHSNKLTHLMRNQVKYIQKNKLPTMQVKLLY